MQCVEIRWPNGRLKRSVHFQNGVRTGLDQMWNEEGILVDTGSYEQGIPVGVHQRWNAKGRLIEEIIHLDPKRMQFRNWDDAGNLRTEAIWLDDIHYVEKAWDRFQNIWIEKKGVWDGTQIQYLREVSPSLKNGFSILQERYPLLALLLPSWTPTPTLFEGVAPFEIGKAEALYIYGLGDGAPYFQFKHWLHENQNRKLIFLEDDEGHFAHFLHSPQSVSILEDPQVHFELLEKDIQAIAEKFPIQRIEMVAIASKNKKRFQLLKLELLRKTALSHALYQDRLHGYQPFQNFIQNLRHLPASFYANGLKDAFVGIPAIVCGAGPSLQNAIPLLKTLGSRALIIAGGSTLAALSSQGVKIHFGMAIDPNLEELRRMKNSFAFDTPLLYSTRVHPGVFQTCNGPFGYMRSGIGGILEVWMEESLGLDDQMIGELLSPESISVTNICTAWAEFLGCSTILFCGVDLAYTNQKRYAPGVESEEEVSFSLLDAEKSSADRILKRKDRVGKPIQTATRWVMEAAALSSYAKTHKNICFINTTDGGLPIPGIPFMSLSDAADRYLTNYYPLDAQIKEQIAKFLMPEQTAQIIESRMIELTESLIRVIDHLEVLSLKKGGSLPLAELELKEEMAIDFLFYDIFEILDKEKTLTSQEKWERFLSLAKKYQASFSV